MLSTDQLPHRLNQVFAPNQADTPAEAIVDAYSALVNTSDFNELKEIVRDWAQAQNLTEARVEELAQAQNRLAQAQNRTEMRMEELAQAQIWTMYRSRCFLGG